MLCRVIQFFLMVIALQFATCDIAWAKSVRDDAVGAIASGQSFDIIVEYDDSAVEKVAKEMRKKTRNHSDDEKTRDYKVKEYRSLRQKVEKSIATRSDIESIANYKHMPMSHKRIYSVAAMDALLSQPGIKAVYQNGQIKKALVQSLALINQPEVAYVGEKGQNTSVVVIDDGIDLTNPAFTLCSSPTDPTENCNVAMSLDMVSNPGYDSDHGTNIAAIVLGVAPNTKITAINIFDDNGEGLQSDVIAAINWAIDNASTYHIVAINISLSDNSLNSGSCANNWASTAINRAAASGISVVVSAGNNGYTSGLGSPACAPDAISVGAVYDSNVGARGYLSARCRDLTTKADQVACFSNSASNLTLLAPGSIISAAGYQMSGTSQAAPHVAGAVAVLRSTYPNESIAQIQARMTNTGVPIKDTRNNITTPRLDLLAAATPINDMFANRSSITGLSGSSNGTTLLASKELAEPSIEGNAGGQSLWWKWTAPQSGQLSLNTNGSSFDSLLGVYTGNQLSLLNPLASKDNTGSLGRLQENLVMEVTAGTEYEISLDVANGEASAFVLNWSLNTSPQANLSTTITGPSNVVIGSVTSYTLTVNNAGPQAATHVVSSLTAPAGNVIATSSKNCSIKGNTMSCTSALLSNGSSQSFSFQITWNTVTSANVISATSLSDVSNNNTQATTVSIQLGAVSRNTIGESPIVDSTDPNSADAPSLPEWGIIILGLTILLVNLKTSKNTVKLKLPSTKT